MGGSWSEEDLVALGFGPDAGERMSPEESLRGQTYLGRGRSDEGWGGEAYLCSAPHTSGPSWGMSFLQGDMRADEQIRY